MARPRKPEAERRSRMISVRAGLDRRTGLPDLLRALRPPVLPVSGAGGVRPGGRGDRRRCGGNADHAAAGHNADSREIDGLGRR